MLCWYQICMQLNYTEWKSELLRSRTLSVIWYSADITVYQKLVALPLGRNRLTDFVRSKSVSEWLKTKLSFWNFYHHHITCRVWGHLTCSIPINREEDSWGIFLVLLTKLDAGQIVGTSNGMHYIPLPELFRMKIDSFNWDKLCTSRNKKLSMVSGKLCKYLKKFLNILFQ
jgi:hypothetical protein